MLFTTWRGDEKRRTAFPSINNLSFAPFKALLNVYERSWSYGPWQKLRTYGGIWSCSVFDLRYWHQQLALICQTKPTVLLAEQFWPLHEDVFLFFLVPSLSIAHNSVHATNWLLSTYLYFLHYNSPHCQMNVNSLCQSVVLTSCDGWSQSPQTAVKVSSAALSVISVLPLRMIALRSNTLLNGGCSSVCHVSFITAFWLTGLQPEK